MKILLSIFLSFTFIQASVWYTWQGNMQHTGCVMLPAINEPVVAWYKPIGSSVSLDDSMKIYSTYDKQVRLYDYFGNLRWSYEYTEEDRAYDVSSDGMYAFFTYYHSTMYDFDRYTFYVCLPNHQEKWNKKEGYTQGIGTTFSCFLRCKDTWFAGGEAGGYCDSYSAGFVRLFDDDGNDLYRCSLKQPILSLAADSKGMYYACVGEGRQVADTYPPTIYAISVLWHMGKDLTHSLSGDFTCPQIDDRIDPSHAYTLHDSTFLCLNAKDGGIIWSIKVHDTYPPAIDTLGNLFLPNSKVLLYKLARNGQLLGSVNIIDDIVASPVIDKDGNVYVATTKNLISYSSNLTKRWSFYTGYNFRNGLKLMLGERQTIFLHQSPNLLAITDITATKEVRDATSVPAKDITASPNPFIRHLNLYLPCPSVIYNLTGQAILSLKEGKHSIDTTRWSKGVYMIKSGYVNKRIVKVE